MNHDDYWTLSSNSVQFACALAQPFIHVKTLGHIAAWSVACLEKGKVLIAVRVCDTMPTSTLADSEPSRLGAFFPYLPRKQPLKIGGHD